MADLYSQVVSGVSPRVYRIVCGAALGSLCVIVFTGALVRLTGSGLGCEDWPRCNQSKFVDVSSGHTLIEQANRLFTGVVSASVILAVLVSHRVRPKRRDLVALAWSLVVGVVAQVIIGGIVVLTGLNPYANMAHFLVSLLLIGSALVLYRRAAVSAIEPWWRHVSVIESRYLALMAFLSVTAIVTGTVVTATGPHAGDENAVRFGFSLEAVARVHGTAVMATLVVLLLLMWRTRRSTDVDFRDSLAMVAFVGFAQAGVGYLQYFTGVPVVLVAAHIVGAVSLFVAVLNTLLVPRPVHIGAE
jgi:heme a synthase